MRIDLVDVFGAGVLAGNPLAVVHGAGALGAGQMQELARWLGFSETTFLLPPTDPAADYAVRIFTPVAELPFAGHPTLGSAFAFLAAGGAARGEVVMQQCGVGLVPVRVLGAHGAARRLAFRAPPLRRSGQLSPAERDEAVLAAGVAPGAVVDAVWADNGPPWRLLRLDSAEAVRAAAPAPRWEGSIDIGLVARDGDGWLVRAFFSKQGGALAEDPVTGSLNAGIAQYLFASGLAQGAYVAAQGASVGADGRVFVSRDGAGDVWVAGDVAAVAQGGGLSLAG